MYVAWLSIQYQAFTYSTASGTYGFSRVLMIFRFITIRATEPCLNLEYSGFRSRETNSPYNLIGGARRRLSSRDRVQPPLGYDVIIFCRYVRTYVAIANVRRPDCGARRVTKQRTLHCFRERWPGFSARYPAATQSLASFYFMCKHAIFHWKPKTRCVSYKFNIRSCTKA